MPSRVKLQLLEIENFLGAGAKPVILEPYGGHAALCGPNGSGKTTVLSALDCLKRALIRVSSLGRPFIQSYGGPGEGVRYRVGIWEWVDLRPYLTAELFHAGTDRFQIGAHATIPMELLNSQVRFADLCDPAEFGFEISARKDQKIRLEHLRLGNQDVFRNGVSCPRFELNQKEAQGWINYLTPYTGTALTELFDMPLWLLRRIIFFPSYRRAALGSNNNSGLAAGTGLVNWIEAAANPDPRDAESERQHRLLQEFQQEFAEFAGFKTVSLSVRKYSLPLAAGEAIDINVTIDGRLRLLSQLGAGIGEALIVLLGSKLSQEWQDPPIDIVLLEEPELHIHPSLQRRLLERLAEYGVQIIAATHSPTVVNWFARNGGAVFRTQLRESENWTTVRPVSGLSELRELIEVIGASPADVVLADRVLLVEGSNDVPVFSAWLRKAPSYAGQNVAVLPLGGSDAASSNFDPKQWSSLHPKIRAILDSERKSIDESPQRERDETRKRLEGAGIRCYLTERRSTESYFTVRALKSVYGDYPYSLDPFGDPNLTNQGVKQFTKSRNGEVARTMEWAEIKDTDLGKEIEDFLTF